MPVIATGQDNLLFYSLRYSQHAVYATAYAAKAPNLVAFSRSWKKRLTFVQLNSLPASDSAV